MEPGGQHLRHQQTTSLTRRLWHRLLVTLGASGMTVAFFLVLPLIQAISAPPDADMMLTTVDTANLPPPPPPPVEEEPEEEPEPEEQPPELTEEAPPLTLDQIDLALNPGFSDSWLAGDFTVDLGNIAGGAGDDVDALFSLSDLDTKPRIIYQPGPVYDKAIRKQAPGSVAIIFIVDKDGRVENPLVQSSSDPVFERSALAAVKKWKFEPGKRNGESVRFRMRVPITFAKGQ